MQTTNGTRIDRAGDERTDYPLPDGAGRMPQPRKFPTEGPIPAGSGTVTNNATLNSVGRRPTTHPALR